MSFDSNNGSISSTEWGFFNTDLVDMEIPPEILDQWQGIVDTLAELVNVPAGLIMRVKPPSIEVLVSSNTVNNPYRVGASEHLKGLYCETVVKTQGRLLVPNALEDEDWKDNPDIKLNMVSYLGLPINWPTGTPFGTICVLDKNTNGYSSKYIRLLDQFKSLIEANLALLLKNKELENEVLSRKAAEAKLSQQKDYLLTLNTILRHDLRNNFVLINGALKLTNETSDEFITMVEKAVTKSLSLMNELRSVEQTIDQFSPFKYYNLYDNITRISSYYSVPIEIIGGHPDLGVLADDTLNSIFDNLFSNAIVHGKTNKISVYLTDLSEKVLIIVEDYGRGIDRENYELMFNKGEAYGSTGNTGLGLFLTRSIIERYGGKVYFEPKQTDGVKLVIELPKASLEDR